jgi:hypothetical protein
MGRDAEGIWFIDAGLAYKRDGQLLDAEGCYIQALGALFVAHGMDLDLNHENTIAVIGNMLVLCDDQNLLTMSQDGKVFNGFLALLYAAGFRPGRERVRSRTLVNSIWFEMARDALLPKYQTQLRAKKVLALVATAVEQTTAKAAATTPANTTRSGRLHFRSIISGCMPDILLPFHRILDPNARDVCMQSL